MEKEEVIHIIIPNPPLPWLRRSGVAVPGVQQPLPKHLDNKEPTENHIDKFILVVQTMNVQHEDVVLCLF